ncbi:MAG: hypothetical protein H7A24_17505 [Leptospiraceae bacterium]|nr:hypothetical protein [Leptospiraceae bacterium]MCP5513690.1 hypothetical protein [Leptospiraceae bacterium]
MKSFTFFVLCFLSLIGSILPRDQDKKVYFSLSNGIGELSGDSLPSNLESFTDYPSQWKSVSNHLQLQNISILHREFRSEYFPKKFIDFLFGITNSEADLKKFKNELLFLGSSIIGFSQRNQSVTHITQRSEM